MPDQPAIVDPDRRDLVDEFRRRPLGPYSGDLQRLLNVLRSEPLAGKHVLVCTEPGRAWVLAQLGGAPGQPVRILGDHVFRSLEEAEWAVFRRRWERLTGRALEA